MPPSTTLLDQLSQQADPAADDVVARLVAEFGPGQSKALFDVLIRNLHVPVAQMPPYVQAYMEAQALLPAWADHDKLRRAEEVFEDRGVGLSCILYYRSLPECYLLKPIAEVLHTTGRLSGRNWPQTHARRVGETTQFVLDVMAPGGLQPGGIGIQTLLRVRLVHAAIRHATLARPDWDRAILPINQEMLAYTLLTFGYSMPQGLLTMGRSLSPADAEAFFHRWNVAGHLMGVTEAGIQQDISQAAAFMDAIYARHAADTEAGRACTAALIAFSEEILRGEMLDSLPAGLVRHFIGAKKSALLGVPDHKGCLAQVMPAALLRFMGLSARLEDRFGALEPLIDRMGMGILRGLRKYYDGYKGGQLRTPARWGV